MEDKLAKTLRLELGDVLGFDINGTVINYTISNLRSVDWDTFNINFFTVVPPGVLEDKPANWVTSVYLDAGQRQQLGELVRLFPNITLIDVDTIMQRVRGIMDRVSLAIEFIFLFTILAGLAVLYAAIQANQDEHWELEGRRLCSACSQNSPPWVHYRVYLRVFLQPRSPGCWPRPFSSLNTSSISAWC